MTTCLFNFFDDVMKQIDSIEGEPGFVTEQAAHHVRFFLHCALLQATTVYPGSEMTPVEAEALRATILERLRK